MKAWCGLARNCLELLGPFAVALSVGACSDPDGSVTRFGAIYVHSDSTSEPTQGASAFFYRFTSQAAGSSCYVVDQPGSCRLWHCDDYEPFVSTDVSSLSAGSVSVSGGAAELALVETEPGKYDWENTLLAPLWAGGERLEATVGGTQDFPGATISVIAPDPITVTEPVVPAEGLQIDTAQPLELAWAGAVRSDVYLALSIAVPDPDGGQDVLFPAIDCGFVGDAGAGAVPASVLQRMTKPAGLVGHELAVLTFGLTTVRVDDAIIDFRATSAGLISPATIE
jgi:hypothetical protein